MTLGTFHILDLKIWKHVSVNIENWGEIHNSYKKCTPKTVAVDFARYTNVFPDLEIFW